jgi:nucleoside-diphosphate-sugar epimerase
MRVLIIGCGYVGLPLGQELVRAGHKVYGVRRRAAGGSDLKQAGIEPVLADISRRETLESLPAEVDWVVNCAAASGGGLEDYRRTYYEGTMNLLARFASSCLLKYVYTSSTSVYGQLDGNVVTETSAAEPSSPAGKILVETETLLRTAAEESGFPGVILRAAGIYGPGRGYWFKQFVAGLARLEAGGTRFLNMVHRDDVAGAIVAALAHGKPGAVYNVSDDEPVTQRAFFEWMASRLGRAIPPEAAPGGEAARRREITNKRVSNERLKRELDYRFKYPSFREGYAEEVARALTQGT